ncbi:MAG TPA: phage antirepressor N-terminal domain-containing protein [Ktedonobacterales bacterium]|nr:phage antirepressor N-terminal domain-containing protein [Ktedonobacterales bacterium]
MEQDAIIPLEQQTIPFYEQPLVALRLADDRIIVVIRWLCTNLKLDPQAQLRRIKRTKAIADEVVSAHVETEGGVQVMPALSLRALPFWLAGIDTHRLDPTIEPVILAYQREVVDVLYRHFAQKRQQHADPHHLVPTEPITQPALPGHDAPPDVWLAYHEQMVVWLRWQHEVETWRGKVDTWHGSVEHRLEHVEELAGLVPEILERLGPQTLSPAHLRTVQASVNRVHDVTGQSHASIYEELRDHFHVGTYKEIPEDRWADVMAWFQARLQWAQRTQDQQSPLLFDDN